MSFGSSLRHSFITDSRTKFKPSGPIIRCGPRILSFDNMNFLFLLFVFLQHELPSFQGHLNIQLSVSILSAQIHTSFYNFRNPIRRWKNLFFFDLSPQDRRHLKNIICHFLYKNKVYLITKLDYNVSF